MRCKELGKAEEHGHGKPKAPKTKQVWRPPKVKSQVQSAEASVNMVFMLPSEFSALQIEDSSQEEESARLTLDPQQAVFEKPIGNDHFHLKALYINGFINGKSLSKMLVDGGVAVNVVPMTTYRKIRKLPGELIKTNMTLRDYGGRSSEVSGVTTVEVTVGSKTLPTTFFVIEGK